MFELIYLSKPLLGVNMGLTKSQNNNRKLRQKSWQNNMNKPNQKIIGIQGGAGSFNEITVKENLEELKYLISQRLENQDKNLKNTFGKNGQQMNLKTEYLFTTDNVLKSLENGKIDYGLFAFVNSIGGIVAETAAVLGHYKFEFVHSFKTQISHTLMKLDTQHLSQINQIMAHDQVFRQCKSQLTRKYNHLKRISGIGDLTDNGSIALALSENKLENTAILMSNIMTDIYDNLEIIEENLEDNPNNYTTFLLVAPFGK